MLQITPQMRILVAAEAVDFRKGIDSLALRIHVRVSQPAGAIDEGVGL